jgi:hypothetical protein
MTLQERIGSFAALGGKLRQLLSYNPNGSDVAENELLVFNDLIDNQHKSNPWFTPGNVRKAFSAIADELTEENLARWTGHYSAFDWETPPVKIGVIMAGNIPLVGFHDFLTVLITGNKLIAKSSSKDNELIMFVSELLCSINPEFRRNITFTESAITGFDAVIATGSDNSSRYFEYYFSKYPNIIRKNRNSIAILSGKETDSELEALGTDIFSYFGLGCRNVSKLYIPSNYELKVLTDHWEKFGDVINNSKYANNYDFNKAVYIVNREAFYDTGHLLLRQDSKISSPVSVLYYEFYDSQEAVKQQTELLREKIQCIVGEGYFPFGSAQSPHLWDYADGIDTIEFLLKKKLAGIL